MRSRRAFARLEGSDAAQKPDCGRRRREVVAVTGSSPAAARRCITLRLQRSAARTADRRGAYAVASAERSGCEDVSPIETLVTGEASLERRTSEIDRHRCVIRANRAEHRSVQPHAMANDKCITTPPLPFPRRGGARRGAGRKRTSERPRVSHKARRRLVARHPVMVTIRLRAGLPSLRRKSEFDLIKDRLAIAAERFGVRLVEYSIQSNHAHFIVEVSDERAGAGALYGFGGRKTSGM
jgi:hypothetical protein